MRAVFWFYSWTQTSNLANLSCWARHVSQIFGKSINFKLFFLKNWKTESPVRLSKTESLFLVFASSNVKKTKRSAKRFYLFIYLEVLFFAYEVLWIIFIMLSLRKWLSLVRSLLECQTFCYRSRPDLTQNFLWYHFEPFDCYTTVAIVLELYKCIYLIYYSSNNYFNNTDTNLLLYILVTVTLFLFNLKR